MIAIATGIKGLDEKIKENIEQDTMVVNYREFLLKEKFEIVITSRHLLGAIDLEQLIFALKQNNTRIIYLTDEENEDEIRTCLVFGVYDVLLDPITVSKIQDSIKIPKSLSDETISKLFMKYISGEDISETKSKLKDFFKKKANDSEAKTTTINENGLDNSSNIEIKEVEKQVIKVVEKEVPVEKVVEKVVEKEIPVMQEKIVERYVISQQHVIAFWGYTGGMGTSTTVYETAKEISKKNKVVVLDFEEITGNISKLAKIENNNMEYLIKLIDSEEITLPILKESLTKKGNIDYLTGITIKNFYKMKDKHFLTIIRLLKKEYPCILICAGNGIHTAGTLISLYEADKIVSVVEGNKHDFIKTLEMINFVSNRWEIDKSKFNLLVNKMTITSDIDNPTIKDISVQNGINFMGSAGSKPDKIYHLTKTLFSPVSVSEKVISDERGGGKKNVFKPFGRKR